MRSFPVRSLTLIASLLATTACHHAAPGDTSARGDAVPDDGRIAGVALTANNVELRYAMLAATRATNTGVRAYAERLRTDHTSLVASLTDLLARLDLAAVDDPMGAALRDSSTARRERLTSTGARAFDLAYLDLEIQSHRELLGVLDQLRTPGARRPELREYVDAMRPAVVAHMAHAELLRTSLAARRR